MKRIFWTLLITGVILTPTTATQAQSAGRNPRTTGASVNNPVPAVPDQEPEREPVAELQTASQEKKTAVVGSWLGTTTEGNKLIVTYNSDGTTHGSVQTEVSTIPELGVLTPTHGVWKHLGGRQFGVTVMGVLYDINTGAYLGKVKVRNLLTLNEAGDQMSGTDKVEIINPDGTVISLPSGNTPYTRIKFEPFN
jgi:hypothetical protein